MKFAEATAAQVSPEEATIQAEQSDTVVESAVVGGSTRYPVTKTGSPRTTAPATGQVGIFMAALIMGKLSNFNQIKDLCDYSEQNKTATCRINGTGNKPGTQGTGLRAVS